MITKPSSSIKTQLIRRIFFPILLLFVVVGGVALFSADDEIGEVTDAHSFVISKEEDSKPDFPDVEFDTLQERLLFIGHCSGLWCQKSYFRALAARKAKREATASGL